MGRLHKLGTFLIIGVIALSACAFIAVPTPKKTAASSSSSKRALLANAPVDQTMINNFGPMSMYYSYGPTPGGLQLNGPFTAMIDSPQGMTSANLAAAKASSDTFLSFNEPDGGTQVLSVSDALSYWPTLENLGMRLGAPALSHYAGASKAWLDSFSIHLCLRR
jgi:hypothetical protein